MGQFWLHRSWALHHRQTVQVKKEFCTDNVYTVIRNMEISYQKFVYADVKTLTRQTGCLKPCKYRKYRLIGDPQVKDLRSKIPFLPMSPANAWYRATGVCSSSYFQWHTGLFEIQQPQKGVKSKNNLGGDWRADLPLAILFGWIWRSPGSFPWILLHDYFGFCCVSS